MCQPTTLITLRSYLPQLPLEVKSQHCIITTKTIGWIRVILTLIRDCDGIEYIAKGIEYGDCHG